jgi:hypothetical protein
VVNLENKYQQQLKFSPSMNNNYQGWQGDLNTVSFDAVNIKNKLMNLNSPCYILLTVKLRNWKCF